MNPWNSPPCWSGMRRFTRGLLFLLAGMIAFFPKGDVGPSVGRYLLAAGIILFLVGFAVAKRGIARGVAGGCPARPR